MRLNESIKNALTERQAHSLRRARDLYRELFDPFPYRMYMRRHACIFVHVPKCAGSSIRRALGANVQDRDHFGVRVYLQASPSRFASYYKFAFVRNPWDRVLSVYEYWKRGGNQTSDLKFTHWITTTFPTFELFVNQFLSTCSISDYVLLRPQYQFLCVQGKDIAVDFVGRYETLESDFAVVQRRLGISSRLPSVNRAPKTTRYQDSYSATSAERVAALYATDIDLFQYRFD